MISNALFFMLSGKFNLRKKFESKEDYKKYYKSKIINIIIPFLIISALIYIALSYKDMSFIDFLKKFIEGKIQGTYWFIYSLIGMLAISPFFSKMLNNMNKTDKKIFFWLSMALSGIVVALSIFKINSAITFNIFGILYWNFYYLLGSFVEEIFETKRERKIAITLGVIDFIIQFLLERFYKSGYRLYNPSPILTFEAIGLYFIILDFIKIKNTKVKKYISYIAKHTYIFYLLHAFVIMKTFELFNFNLKESSKMNFAYGLLAYVVSFIVTLVFAIIIRFIYDYILQKISKNVDKKRSK